MGWLVLKECGDDLNWLGFVVLERCWCVCLMIMFII